MGKTNRPGRTGEAGSRGKCKVREKERTLAFLRRLLLHIHALVIGHIDVIQFKEFWDQGTRIVGKKIHRRLRIISGEYQIR